MITSPARIRPATDGAFSCSTRRADAVRSAADAHILQRADGFLLRINNFQFLHATFLHLTPHDLCQRAHVRLVNICHTELRRIQFVSGSHTADDRHVARFGAHDDLDLCRYRIDSIDNVRILREIKSIRIFRQIEAFVCFHLCFWIDVKNPLLHHVYFIFSNAASCRNNLTVDIGQADFIVVHQHKMADTASCQRLHGIAAHAADTENGNGRIRQKIHALLTQQKLCSGKLI